MPVRWMTWKTVGANWGSWIGHIRIGLTEDAHVLRGRFYFDEDRGLKFARLEIRHDGRGEQNEEKSQEDEHPANTNDPPIIEKVEFSFFSVWHKNPRPGRQATLKPPARKTENRPRLEGKGYAAVNAIPRVFAEKRLVGNDLGVVVAKVDRPVAIDRVAPTTRRQGVFVKPGKNVPVVIVVLVSDIQPRRDPRREVVPQSESGAITLAVQRLRHIGFCIQYRFVQVREVF